MNYEWFFFKSSHLLTLWPIFVSEIYDDVHTYENGRCSDGEAASSYLWKNIPQHHREGIHHAFSI